VQGDAWSLEERFGSSGAGVPGDPELPGVVWEPNSGSSAKMASALGCFAGSVPTRCCHFLKESVKDMLGPSGKCEFVSFICADVCVYMHVHMCARMYACVHVCVRVCALCVCTCVCAVLPCVHVHVYPCACIYCVYVCACACVCLERPQANVRSFLR